MTGWYEGNRREFETQDVEVHVIGPDHVRVKAKAGKPASAEDIFREDVSYAAWFQLQASKPGDIVNILRRRK